MGYKRCITKEKSIASRLAKRVKNFAGSNPAIIKVQIKECVVTIQFRWLLTAIEKSLLEKCDDQVKVGRLRTELFQNVSDHLLRAFWQVFKSKVRIMDLNEDILQEKITVQAQVLVS